MKPGRWIFFIGLSLIFLISISSAFAEDVCLSEESARQITVDLEKCVNLKEQVELYIQANAELERQVSLLKEMNKLKDEQIAIGDKTIKQYQELLKTQEDVYKQAIKDIKPDPIKKLIDSFGFIGIGVLLGVLLL